MLGYSLRSVLKKRAVDLRRQGYSYSLINSRLRVPKSTLNYWLRNIPYEPNKIVLRRIREAPVKSLKILKAKRAESIKSIKQTAKKEIGKLSRRDVWMVGIGLYMGEGYKGSANTVRFINSDPKLIKVAITWLQKICGLGIKNFRVSIHTYPDLDLNRTLEFWSQITGIPRKQFGKTQIDRRTNKLAKNKGKSPYGTAHVTVHSDRKKEFGVYLFRKIISWIEIVENQANAGVVQW